jgi:exosortase family protein XrtG
MLIPSISGWSLLKIGIECSALIEMAVLIGLVMFHPGLPVPQRVRLTAIGLVATYALNIGRLLIIVWMASSLGPDSMFVAHAIVGRAFFFALVVALYWVLLTRTALRRLARGARPA